MFDWRPPSLTLAVLLYCAPYSCVSTADTEIPESYDDAFYSIYDLQSAFHPIRSIEEFVDTENFTYFSLELPTQRGVLALWLTSLSGDCDLYVTGANAQPDWTNYLLKSDSCGVDYAVLAGLPHRAVSVGVYGYSALERNHCRLQLLANSPNAAHTGSTASSHPDGERLTILDIVVAILKILVDVVVS